MKKQTYRALAWVVLLVGLLLFGIATEWRVRAVALKLTGRLSAVSWGQVLSLFTDYQNPSRALGAGLVTLGQEAPGSDCPLLWATPMGDFWGHLGQELTMELLMKEQLVDRIYDQADSRVRAGDVVIDVGGHLGTFTRFALDRNAARVVVFEPELKNLACLKRTFEDELRRGTVLLVEAAAWHEAGVLRFTGEDGTGHVDDQGETSIQAVTIDDTVMALGLDRVDFIKMDIEGAEPDALRGARQTLSKYGPKMALSSYHEPEHPREIRQLVMAARPQYQSTETAKFSYFY